MAKESMDDGIFRALLTKIHQETDSPSNKVQILYGSRGYFNAEQASLLLHALSRHDDKIKAIRILEPRLCRMSCRDARDILTSFSIHNDRLIALDCVKRVLTDCQTPLGEEYILSIFPFENDKRTAIDILRTVRSDIASIIGSGGHQGYAALGGLYTQSRPLNLHLYGDLVSQKISLPGQGKIYVPPTAQPGIVPSIYTGHPSYSLPRDKSYMEDHGYPGTLGYPAQIVGPLPYPGGAPPLGHHSGCPAPTGFPKLDARGFAY